MASFIGRKEELNLLNSLLDKRTASLVVIYGRRRIGKSRLVEEFGRSKTILSFSGLAPQPQSTRQTQLDEFSRQMAEQLPMDNKNFTDWTEAFNALAKHVKHNRMILFFDEISWVGSCDPDFLGKLKNAWDMRFKKNDQLIVILCGSVSPWINKNILSNTGFYGRISLKIQLNELPLSDCSRFFNENHELISSFDQIKVLSVTGGIPKYLEEINSKLSSEENIKRLCFLPSGLLFNDYDYIFSALLQRESEYYEKIILLLQDSCLEQNEIVNLLGKESGGTISSFLDELTVSGFISRDHTWNLKSGEISHLSKYRLSDNYLRFYLKYIKPNIPKIKNNQFKQHSLSALPGWASIMGLQVENLVISNRHAIKERLGIYPDEIIYDNPFFQRKTARQKGCQIDYMVQTKHGDLYVCEIKFSRNPIRGDVIGDVKSKISNLSIPKNFSIKPVLIHASEVSDAIIDSNYFAKILDIRDLVSSQ